MLIVAINCVATAFVQSHFLARDEDRDLIGVICSGLHSNAANSLTQEEVTDETCYIYSLKSDPSVIICQCRTAVQNEQCHSFVEQVRKYIST